MRKLLLVPILILLLTGFIWVSSVCYKNCAITLAGKAMTRQFEGLWLTVYKDIYGNDTYCYGHLRKKGEKVKDLYSIQECEDIFETDLKIPEKALNRNMQRPLYPSQVNALVDFFFNDGYRPPVMARVNQSQDPGFTLYDKGIRGLAVRRKLEASLYASD